jgi:hypothetical protein
MRSTCPKCGAYSVAYDGDRQVTRCHSYTCDYEEDPIRIKDITKKLFSGGYDDMTVEEFRKEVGL